MKKIFIDGSAGTTGLRIYERIENQEGVEVIRLSDDRRKDYNSRKEAINSADIVMLCLPDDAAREAVGMIENDNTVVIDTSTAHRTEPGWAYGFPELSAEFEEKIRHSKRIAVPGCHASGFIALVYPLLEAGIITPDTELTCHSVTGYSGGGKKMIAQYESEGRDTSLDSPRQYGLSQTHKHLKEMKAVTGLLKEPIFCPIVSDFYSGMAVTVPLFKSMLNGGKSVCDIKKIYSGKYNSDIVRYAECSDDGGFLSANKLSGKDNMEISVFGNDERILLTARYDNLGKGASGAAIECLNIVLGNEKTKNLSISADKEETI